MGDTPEDIDIASMATIMYRELTAGGPHAFGWMNWKDGDDVVEYQSRQGRADTLDNMEWLYKTIKHDATWFVGHTRWATHGDPKNNANNHPILHDGVIGVHNGVLRNHDEILKITGRHDDSAQVDSEAIFAAVNKWGALPGIKKVEGDMVAIWNDLSQLDTLHIARSEGRYLTIGYTDKGNMIFASQASAIEALHPMVRIVKWTTVDQQKLLTIKGGKIVKREKIREVVKPVAKAIVNPKWAYHKNDSVTEFFASQQQERATRRGESLFPVGKVIKDGKGAPKLVTVPAPKKRKKPAAKNLPDVTTWQWDVILMKMTDDKGNIREATDAEAEFFMGVPESPVRDRDDISWGEGKFDWERGSHSETA